MESLSLPFPSSEFACDAIPLSGDGSGAIIWSASCAASVGIPVLVNKPLARCRMCLEVGICFSIAGLGVRCACVIYLAEL